MLTVSQETFVLDSIEIRPAGAGMGNGTFATADIPKGTRIFAEPPLVFLCPSPRPYTQFCRLVDSLGDKASQIDHLFYNPMLLDREQRGNLFDHIRAENHPLEKTMVKRYATFLTNCNAISRGNDVGRGLFPMYSRINHSCEPNVFCDWNTKLKQETVHAARDIIAGEQIFQGYLSTEDFMTSKERAAKLRSWDFVCRCPACAQPAVSDPVRQRMGVLDAELRMISQLEQNADTDARREIAVDGLQKARAFAGLLEDTGRYSWRLCQAYQACSLLNKLLGNEADAVNYARKNFEAQEIVVGEDGMDRTWIEKLGLRIS